MPHAITIDSAGNSLGQHCVQYGSQINQTVRQGLEFESMLPMVSCDYAYQGQDVDITDILQAYQKAFTPNNTESFGGVQNILQIGKVDLSFDWDELNKFYDKWRCNWFEAGRDPLVWTYPRYIMNQVVIPKFLDELNAASYQGIHVPPTVDVAGPFLGAFDGFKKKHDDAVLAGDIVPIPTGILVDTTMVAQVRDFCKQVPIRYRYLPGKIYMSKTNAQRYADDYQAKYPSRQVNEVNQDQKYLRVDHMMKSIVGLTCMEGSNRIILTFDQLPSLITGTRSGLPVMPTFRIEKFERQLKVLSEFYRFYGHETYKHMFINDQP